MAERVRPGPSGWSYPSTCRVPCTARRTSSASAPSLFPLPRPFTHRSAASGQMYTSPTSEPSGCGSANAITSVTPRRPVARRLRRRIAPPSSSVSSTRAAVAPSHASTRRATRARRATRSDPLGRLPARRDATTRLRVVDAAVVHPADDAHELLLHLLELLKRHRHVVELAAVELAPHDVVDDLFDLLGRELLEDAQRRLDRVGEHRDGGFRRARPRAGIGIVSGVRGTAVAALDRAVEEVGDLH